ncbi:MAG: rod shape-determining protein MreC [Deltaproteobacteria bacterium]|nr:MAG: rod shape-determining protein MreC [Deltaproteobacteria bacterium]
MRSLLKRYRELIFVVALLAIPFSVFFVKAKKAREMTFLDRAVVALIAPVERILTGIAFVGIDAWQSYLALRRVREENVALRRENLRASTTLQQAAELRLENERLRRLLDFEDKQSGLRLLVARIVAVGASPHSHTLRIARGSDDGIVKGSPVIAPEGVVGMVSQLTGSYADVQLIVAPLSYVPALSQRTRSRSTVHGTGDISRCKLEYALRNDDLHEGDVLVTAGAPNSFPPGLRLGHVTNVQRKPVGLFTAAEVIPAVDFSRLDEVAVIVQPAAKPPADGIAEAPAGATP